jgi:hypothetical protein
MNKPSSLDRAAIESFMDFAIEKGKPIESMRERLIEMALINPLETGFLIGSLPSINTGKNLKP